MKNNERVVMILAEPCHDDSRVMRQAKTLVEAGYKVTILALYGKGLNMTEEHDGYRIIRLCCWLPGSGITAMVAREAFFYLFSFFGILCLRPLVCHIHNPRALMPGVLAAKLIRAKIVYDSHEFWAATVSRIDFPQWVFKTVVGIEDFLASRVDIILTVSGSIAGILRRRFRRPVFLIRNVSDLPDKSKDDILREVLGLQGDKRKIILYQGLFLEKRGILETIEAMQWVDKGAIFILLGYDGDKARGITTSEIKLKINRLGLSDRIFIYGPVPAALMLHYTISADFGICVLDPSYENHLRSLPNKFFSYVAAGLPVIVNDFPDMGQLVSKYRIGVTVNSTKPEDIAEKLNILLNSNGVYKQDIARFNRVFNWVREGKRLLKIYENLLSA